MERIKWQREKERDLFYYNPILTESNENDLTEMKREAGGQGEFSVGRIFGAATPPRGASTVPRRTVWCNFRVGRSEAKYEPRNLTWVNKVTSPRKLYWYQSIVGIRKFL